MEAAPQMTTFTPDDVRRSFARNLRTARDDVGLTRKQLAEKCGWIVFDKDKKKWKGRGVEMIYQLESNRSAPSMERLSVLAAELGTTPAKLLGLVPPEEDVAAGSEPAA